MTGPSGATESQPGSRARLLVLGTLGLLASLPLAVTIAAIHSTSSGNLERAVALSGLVVFALMGLTIGVVLVILRRAASPYLVGQAIVSASAVALMGIYLYWASPAVFLRADTLIWSEGPFVSDIMKFRIGYPLYTSPANLESFFYPPGTQLLTYALARISGFGTSIPAYRVVQLVYAAVAALLATATTIRLLGMARPERASSLSPWWGVLLAPLMFLCATNALTNPFAHLLHNDGLSVLVSALAYYLLVEYAATRRLAFLIALALVPAAGFYVKQSLVIWAALVTGYLVVFDEPRSIRRAATYAVSAFGLAALGYGLGRMAWGPDFYAWIIEDLRNHPFSVLRSFQHALDTWMYFAAGIVGGLLLIGKDWRRLGGLWVVFMLLLSQEAYTSGIAWMVNHLGPGSLLAAVWFGAALVAVWPRDSVPVHTLHSWSRAGLATLLTLFCFSGLQLVRIPMRSIPTDIERYVTAIEREFVGMNPARVLLDAGTWVYLPSNTVMKDRSAALGDLAYSGLADLSGIQQRIRTRHYARILMRAYGTEDFAFDHPLWPKSSGLTQLLAEHYRAVRRIPAVEGEEDGTPYLREITVLEPAP